MYDAVTKSWTAVWKWSGGVEPGILQNQSEAYSVPHKVKGQYEEELAKWIEDGWLVLCNENKCGPPKGLIPLMIVVQCNKGKV